VVRNTQGGVAGVQVSVQGSPVLHFRHFEGILILVIDTTIKLFPSQRKQTRIHHTPQTPSHQSSIQEPQHANRSLINLEGSKTQNSNPAFHPTMQRPQQPPHQEH